MCSNNYSVLHMILFSRTKALFMNILLLDSVRILLIYALDPLLRQDDWLWLIILREILQAAAQPLEGL